MLLTSNESRPQMLLDILQHMGQPARQRLNLRKLCCGPEGLMTSQGCISIVNVLTQQRIQTAGLAVHSLSVRDPLTRIIHVNFQCTSSWYRLFFFFCMYRICETGSDNRPVRDNRQTTCEYFVDSLFEEAQKVGAKCLSPTEQKKQVNARHFFPFQCFSKDGPFSRSVRSKLLSQE